MPQRILGLDLGSYSIKVAEVVKGFKSFELVHFYEKPVQYNDVLTPEESLAAAVQGVIEDNGLKWDEIITAMPGDKVAARLITLPFGNRRKIDQTINFEIEDFIPFELDEVVYDYHANIIDKNFSEVLVTYANKGEFVKMLTLLNNSGVDPRIICIEGAEFINLMHFGLVPPETSYAIIDIGHTKTNVTIGKGKRLILTRSISVAGKTINAAISEKLSVPIDEAARLKVEAGHITEEENPDADNITKGINESIKSVIDDLLIHIRQTFFSYKDEEGEAVSGVYLCGGTSRLPGLDQYISYKLRQNVTFLDCTDFHFSRIDKTEVHPGLIAQALSLALRGVAIGGGSGINLRTGEFVYRGSVKKLSGGMRQAGVAISLVFFLGIVYFGVQYCALKKKTETISTDITTIISRALPNIDKKMIRSPEAGIAMLQGRKSEIIEEITKLDEALGIPALDILKEITVSLPGRDDITININKLTLNGDRVKIQGMTSSFEQVDIIEDSIEKSIFFVDVNRDNMSKGTKGEIKFSINMRVANEDERKQKQLDKLKNVTKK